MADKAKSAGLNIDYFPTNFVVQNGLIYYIDYECNEYMDEWNFENWGIKYWSKTLEFIEYLTKNNLWYNTNQLLDVMMDYENNRDMLLKMPPYINWILKCICES